MDKNITELSRFISYIQYVKYHLPMIYEIIEISIIWALAETRGSYFAYVVLNLMTSCFICTIYRYELFYKKSKWVVNELLLLYFMVKSCQATGFAVLWIVVAAISLQNHFYKNMIWYISKNIIFMSVLFIISGESKVSIALSDCITVCYACLILAHGYYQNLKLKCKKKWFKICYKEAKLQFHSTLNCLNVGIIAINSAHKPVFHNKYILDLLRCNDIIQAVLIISGMQFKSENDIHNRWVNSIRLADYIHHFLMNEETNCKLGILTYQNRFLEVQAYRATWHELFTVVLSMRDVTNMLELQKEKTESEYKTAILRSVSHELRAPTNGILGMIELMRADTTQKLTPENSRRLEIAIKSCKHLLFLISDLVDFSQIVAGTLRLTFTPFNLKSLMKDCLNLIKIGAEMKRVKIKLEMGSDVPRILKSESHRLSQIILNLLSNSLKFTRNGYIKLIVNLTKPGFISFAVKDTGIGIPQDKLDQLFKAFGRINEELHNMLNPLGCGLGLNISNLLVQYLGGDPIHIDSTEGKGSSFSFQIPYQEEKQRQESISDESDLLERSFISIPSFTHKNVPNSFEVNSKQECPNVLVVDDSEFNRLVLCQMLKSFGINCTEVESGLECLEYIKRHSIHENCLKIVILDYEMIDMKGTQVARQIQEMKTNNLISKVPVMIACTGHTGQEYINECKEAGMVDFIPKPTSLEELKKKMQSAFLLI